MHICIVTTEYLPGPGGGVATYNTILANLLVKSGHDVTVIVKQEGEGSPWEDYDGGALKIIPVPMINAQSGRSIWDDPDLYANEMIHLRTYIGVFANQVAKLLPRLHRDNPFDLVLSQDVEAPTYLIQNERMLFNKMAEVPFIVFIHSPHRQVQLFNDASVYSRQDYHRVIYEEQSIALADHLLAASHYMKDQIVEQLGIAEGKIRVIPYPIGDVPEKEQERQSTEQIKETQPLRVIYTGRIEPRKGIEYLLGAFARIAAKYPQLVLELIGNDTQHAALNKPCSQVFLKKVPEEFHDRIHFLGSISREQLWEHYRKADLGVVPSRWEPFSFTCQEMMACKLPVVATNEVGIAEIFETGKNGFLCPAHDMSALAQKIETVLEKSAKEREQIGQLAHEKVFMYCDNTAILEKTIHFFEKVIAENATSLTRNQRFPPPSNLPYGGHPLRDAHPACTHGAPRRIDRIAVIVTCYNLGAYLNECIQSLESQQRISPYIYIVNDGSTDPETLEALDRYRSRSCVEVLDYTNGGLPVARQRGAEVALEAGYAALMFIDADDTVKPSYLGKAIEVLNRHPEAGAVNAWTHTVGLMNTYWIPPHSQFPLLLAECLSTPAAVIRAEAYEAAGGVCPDLKYSYEDWDFWIALCSSGYALLTIPEPLLNYRMREGSMSREYLFATREHGRREILDRHHELHQRYAKEVQLLTEGYVYYEQGRLRQQSDDFQSQLATSSEAPPTYKRVPLDKKIYRFLKNRIERLGHSETQT